MLVLLDRDGVINVDLPDGVLRLEDFQLIPGVAESVAKLTRAKFNIAVCTNQSAIGKGFTTHDIVRQVHEHMCAEVARAGGRIDAVYYAPEAPDEPSTRRKPAPGMLLEAIAEFGADPAKTPYVGDMIRDLEAAHAAGCPRILVRTGKGAALEKAGIPQHLMPVTVTDNLTTAVELILTKFSGA